MKVVNSEWRMVKMRRGAFIPLVTVSLRTASLRMGS
jgi:hypothetical protein